MGSILVALLRPVETNPFIEVPVPSGDAGSTSGSVGTLNEGATVTNTAIVRLEWQKIAEEWRS